MLFRSAVVTGIAWFGLFSTTSIVWTAIAGATLAALFVHAVGSLGRGGATPLKLALAGAATSAALTSFLTAVALPRGDIAGSVQSWQIGGVGGAGYDSIRQVLPFLAVGVAVSVLSARSLDSLALGDELAAGLGERVALARGVAAAGAVLLWPPPPSPGRSGSWGSSSRTCAGCWWASTTGGCCPSPPCPAPACSPPPTCWVASWPARASSTSASSPR